MHANDRQGLERRCRYGARGALALERLSRAEDGRIASRMKRPLPDGTTHLVTASFIQNPHAPPDTSCLAAMSPVPFDDRGAARIYFGAAFTSVWDNPAAP
ncbi:transposase [Myxococcus xanthus]|nr:transposase [Myxococcus xanthus]